MNITESKMPIIPIEDSKHYSCSEENDTINLENNSNDLNSFQNFLIGNASNNESEKYGGKKCHSLVKRENNISNSNSIINHTNKHNSNTSSKNLNLIKRKKGYIRKDPYGGTHLVLGNVRNNRKLKRKLLWNNCTDQNTNVSELSYIKDFENNSFMHDNSHHMVLYDNKYIDYPRVIPQAMNYNNPNNPDIPMMNIPPSQNKFFQNSSFSRNPYNYFHQYPNVNENNNSNNSTSRNKDYSDHYNSPKKEGKKSSKRLGFLKYLTRDFK
ncbi:nucleus export protein BRR6, putative [Plasmodium ovale wallikeri]|uniref:Nucleus export protein BRR6, putative n=1 Tax=Plasmodium ovale wallikeri TaxID=864142 RepID=A0A1A8ZYB4_PLAOA|nr:nucleus export protein BRR6, putative [Plasmodium ovale wallikeri]SBT49362.1 nucleus export protein BRR6, putative [Plasmodium ovale wallikeri]